MISWILLVCMILFFSNIFGRVAIMLGQNRVIGEIAAGLILGPMVLASWFPRVSDKILTHDSLTVVQALSELGLILLMVEVPWHIKSVKKSAGAIRASAMIAVGGITASFSVGCALGALSRTSIAPGQAFWPFVIFCGISLSVTALPILVRFIQEPDYIHEQSGRLALSAAVYTDLFAWFALALAMTLHFGAVGNVAQSVSRGLALAAYAGAMILVVRPWIKSRVGQCSLSEGSWAMLAFLYCLMSAQVTAVLGFHHAIGAIIAAYVFHDVYLIEQAWRRWIGRFSSLFLTPIFFAFSSIQISFESFLELNLLIWLVIFFLGGLMSKVVGSYAGARICGLEPRISLEVSVLMNTKGTMELVLLSVGMQLGILSENSYIVFVVLAVLSIIITSPLLAVLRWPARRRSSE